MKRILFCLVPWMAMTVAAYGQTRTADVIYTYFDDAPTHGYRVGDECFVPVDDVSHWGWRVEMHADEATIKAEGAEIHIPVRTIVGKTSLPIKACLAKLGGSAEWIVNTDTLQILSDITSINVDSGRVRLTAPLMVKPKAFALSNPSRVVIDFSGARIGPKTTQVLEGGVRLSQYKPTVVRLVIQTSGPTDISKVSNDPTKALDVILTGSAPSDTPSQGDPAKQSDPVKQTDTGKQGDPVIPTGGGKTDNQSTKTTAGTTTTDPGIIDGTAATQTTAFLPLSLLSEDDHAAYLSMNFSTLSQPKALLAKPSPDVLEIHMPGIFMDLPPDFKLATNTVASATTQRTAKGTILTLQFVRPLGAEVVTQGHIVSIKLLKPNVGDGKLLGKVIVVDPGHGGFDNGASRAALHEKDFALELGKLLAERLTDEGATVIMTRSTDVFIPLETRASIANSNHADFFISCHCNDTGERHGDMSGSIVFHHKGNAISRVLAECIQQQIAAVNELPTIGTWSDGKIYPTIGFSVLRNIKMQGVLIEFAFLDNAHDRKVLATNQFKDTLTRAVVRGLKVYLGDAKTK